VQAIDGMAWPWLRCDERGGEGLGRSGCLLLAVAGAMCAPGFLSPLPSPPRPSSFLSLFSIREKSAAAIAQACTLGFYVLGFSRSFGVAFRSAPQVGRSVGVLCVRELLHGTSTTYMLVEYP